MKVIGAGNFDMGSPRRESGRTEVEGPVRNVTLRQSFAIGVTEVTRAELNAFVRATGHSMSGGCYVAPETGETQWTLNPAVTYRSASVAPTANYPANCVSWEDANAYAQWVSNRSGATYRLPTEAEWEYAARAGESGARFWGRNVNSACRFANGADASSKAVHQRWETLGCDDGYHGTAPVGSFRANEWGLKDMLGNVWEWTQDCYEQSYNGAPTDGSAVEINGCRSRVIRGGSWASSPDQLRSAKRSGDTPDARYDMLGFRLVRENG